MSTARNKGPQNKPLAERGARVFAKRLQPPSVIHQACVGRWTLDGSENSVDVVFGKSSYLSLHRFTPDAMVDGNERPGGTLELIHEQPVFGIIKDMKTLRCRFEPEPNNHMENDQDLLEEPALGRVPRTAASDMIVCTSDSGVLSFITYHHRPLETIPIINDFANRSASTGRFVIVKESSTLTGYCVLINIVCDDQISIATPGNDLQAYGAHIAVDPTSRVIAVSSIQGQIKLIFLRPTTRSAFDPVERETKIELRKGTIVQMEFLIQDTEDAEKAIDLAILFYDTHRKRYAIATIHVCLDSSTGSAPEFQSGQSDLPNDANLAVLHLKALPNYPRAMIYVDEEKVTLVTISKGSPTTPITHTHHPPLYLLKREPPAPTPVAEGSTSRTSESTKVHDEYPFISACAVSPATHSSDEQILYLGSHTAEMYRININTTTNQLCFEMVSGERSVGKVMAVLAKQSSVQQEWENDPTEASSVASTIYSTDYLLYSNDQGDGGLLAVQEDREGVNLFAIETLQNSSPILDFCVREPSIPGRDCLYICSGMRDEGSVMRIRSGIATESSGSSNNPYFAGTVGLWGFALNEADEVDTFLVMSFIQSTKVMFNGEGESLEDISEKSGFNLNQATLFAGRICDGTILQVHRTGVVVVWPNTGRTYTWECNGEVIVAADLVSAGVLVLGTVTESQQSTLKFLQLTHREQGSEPSATFEMIASIPLRQELTTICCWSSSMPDARAEQHLDAAPVTRYCCIGTLEPSLVVFKIDGKGIREVYRESLAQDRRDRVTIPQALSIVESTVQSSTDPSQRAYRMLVGLRDGTMLAYGWHPAPNQSSEGSSSSSTSSSSSFATMRMLSVPQLFKIGILPVKFITGSSPRRQRDSATTCSSSVLILADRIWKAEMRMENRLEIDTVLFDGYGGGGEVVSQACSFRYAGPDSDTSSCFAFIVNHCDLQLVTVKDHKAFNYHTTVSLGETPRRVLDITSKKLLLVATVGNKFPADESCLRLVDPDRQVPTAETGDGVTDNLGEAQEQQQRPCTPEFRLRKGEMVSCMAEWKIPRANKADAVYICIGTAQFSTTTAKGPLGGPKSGRLVMLSIKQNKKAEKKDRKYEIELRWVMAMHAPVFAISPFLDKNILVAAGLFLKLLALDLAKKTLVEKATYRERWPISHITTVEHYIFTGSRKESISMYEYMPSTDDYPEALRFLKSARTAKMISDCQSLSSELVVAADVSGGLFGVGYVKDDPSCQHALRDEFGFHLGEVLCRLRLTKLWPRTSERSIRGLVLSQDHSSKSQDILSQSIVSTVNHMPPPCTFQQMATWTVLPWAASTLLPESGVAVSETTTASTPSSESLPQALIGCSHLGSLWGFWRLQPPVYLVLLRLQQTLQTLHHTRPVLGQAHDRFRSISGPMSNVIDGELVLQFLDLELVLQLDVVEQSAGLKERLEQWLAYVHMSTEDRKVFQDYAKMLGARYPRMASQVLARYANRANAFKSIKGVLPFERQGLPEKRDAAGCSSGKAMAEVTGDELDLWWSLGAVRNLLEFLKALHWHQ